MSKKLQGNGLFESSRMMLPEHKEAYILHQRKLRKNARPQLDDQEMERISMLIAESMKSGRELTFVLFGEWDATEFTGVVTKIDRQNRKVGLAQGSDFIWIEATDIVDARLII